MTVDAQKIKSKKCRICGEKFVPRRPLQPVCDEFACKAAFADRVADKARMKREKIERAADREKRRALMTRSDWMTKAQAAFNAYIRSRDRLAGHPCSSSGRPLDWSANSTDAGHYRSVGSAPHLRFDERNCHAQSKQDNRYGSGCAVDYRIGLIARIGLAEVEALEADQTVKKWTIDDLKAITERYTRRANELKKAIG